VKKLIPISITFILAIYSSFVFAQTKHTIRFASISLEGTTPIKIMRNLSAELQKESNGRLQFNIFPGNADEGQIISKMGPKIGRLDGAGLTGRGLGDILPMTRVLELPFLFQSYDEVDNVVSKLQERFAKEFEKNGYVLLGWAEVGFVYIFSKDRIATVQDLRKAKVWTWTGDPLAEELFRALNVSPIPLSLPDVLTQLGTRMINTVYANPYGALTLSWNERTKYMNELPITFATGAVIITKQKYNELEPDLQKLLITTSRKWLAELIIQTRKDNENALNLFKTKGLIFIPKPEGQELKIFQDAGVRVREKLAGKLYPQDLLDQIISLINEVRSKQGSR